MHEAYQVSQLLKLTVQIETIAAYGKFCRKSIVKFVDFLLSKYFFDLLIFDKPLIKFEYSRFFEFLIL